MKQDYEMKKVSIQFITVGDCFKLPDDNSLYMKANIGGIRTSTDPIYATNIDTGHIKTFSNDAQVLHVDARYKIH